jgi:D-glycero-D-manno-heptose 1,7-bisphosphate phosphatase
VDALRALRSAGFLNIVITNQSGIGRGRISMNAYEAVRAELDRQLDHLLDATYFCPDIPEAASARRKPGIGMLLEARSDHGIDFQRSWFVGDKAIDVACGKAAGVRTILVRTGYGRNEMDCAPDFIEDDVAAAANRILSMA